MLLDAVRGGVASVSRTLQEFERTREAGRHGDELASARLLPWRTLGEQFSILEASLQERILRVSVAETFRPELSRVQRPGEPKHILPGCLPMAQASLEADPALAALRYRLVPATLSEEDCACDRSSNLDTRTAQVATALQSLTRPAFLRAGSLALLLLVTRPKPCSRQAPHPMPDATPNVSLSALPPPRCTQEGGQHKMRAAQRLCFRQPGEAHGCAGRRRGSRARRRRDARPGSSGAAAG